MNSQQTKPLTVRDGKRDHLSLARELAGSPKLKEPEPGIRKAQERTYFEKRGWSSLSGVPWRIRTEKFKSSSASFGSQEVTTDLSGSCLDKGCGKGHRLYSMTKWVAGEEQGTATQESGWEEEKASLSGPIFEKWIYLLRSSPPSLSLQSPSIRLPLLNSSRVLA